MQRVQDGAVRAGVPGRAVQASVENRRDGTSVIARGRGRRRASHVGPRAFEASSRAPARGTSLAVHGWMPRATPRLIVSLSAVAIVLALVTLGLQFAAHARFRAARENALAAERLSGELEHVLRLLVDAETGQRGFLLTGREPYLERYELARSDIPQAMESVRAMARGHPTRQTRVEELDTLAHTELEELGETIALEKAGNHDRALAVVKSDRGKRNLDTIRGRIAIMESTEKTTLHAFYARADRLSRLSVAASAAATALLFAVLALLLATARSIRQRQEDRILDLESFAGRVAHDIRSPLATASLGIDVAKRHFGEDAARDALDRSAKTLRRVSMVVEGLLGFARAGQRREEGAVADVASVVREVVATTRDVARERGVEIEVEDVCPTEAACSPGVLTSMLSNLVDNAVKYVGQGPAKRVTVRATSSRGMTHVEVRDNGPGVPHELRSLIFEPYVRAAGSKAPGLGIGLATVRRLAEAHGGSAGLQRNRPSGSVFWFEVPNVPLPREGRAPAKGPTASWRTRWRIARHG
jgi:signal transduction histidine kinase